MNECYKKTWEGIYEKLKMKKTVYTIRWLQLYKTL